VFARAVESVTKRPVIKFTVICPRLMACPAKNSSAFQNDGGEFLPERGGIGDADEVEQIDRPSGQNLSDPLKIRPETQLARPDAIVHAGRLTHEQVNDDGQRQNCHNDDDEQCRHGREFVSARYGRQDAVIERREKDPQNCRPEDRSNPPEE
jgi:hypothetical protein